VDDEYSESIPRRLLVKQFVEDFLDFDGLKNSIMPFD